jgi:hypothetical protein
MFILNEILYAYTCTLSADRRETIFRLFFSAKTISQASGAGCIKLLITFLITIL